VPAAAAREKLSIERGTDTIHTYIPQLTKPFWLSIESPLPTMPDNHMAVKWHYDLPEIDDWILIQDS
jgi:hypothetical protein